MTTSQTWPNSTFHLEKSLFKFYLLEDFRQQFNKLFSLLCQSRWLFSGISPITCKKRDVSICLSFWDNWYQIWRSQIFSDEISLNSIYCVWISSKFKWKFKSNLNIWIIFIKTVKIVKNSSTLIYQQCTFHMLWMYKKDRLIY